MAKRSFRDEIHRLITQDGIEEGGYFLTRLANEDGSLVKSIESHWCGFTETRPRREIREASLLHGPLRRSELHEVGESCLLINHADDYALWLLYGGHAVILETVARAMVPAELKPREVAQASGGFGFVDTGSLKEVQLQHAPSKITRMKVLNRDGRRCFICGRSPRDHVDLELHVHHAVPWGLGGVTEMQNLVTLCGTCHGGLDPHFDWGLVFEVKKTHYATTPTYAERLQRYQRTVREFLQRER